MADQIEYITYTEIEYLRGEPDEETEEDLTPETLKAIFDKEKEVKIYHEKQRDCIKNSMRPF